MATIVKQAVKSTVASRDGTEIAYWTSGDGPPLLLVHGTTGDHTRWGPLLPYLEPHATVVVMDRRGRGESGDAPTYHVEREFEDVAAVVDAIADTHASPVDVYGHSYGALCALGAALLTPNIRKLVLYEPVVDGSTAPWPPGAMELMDDLLEQGKREEIVEILFRDVLGMSDEELAQFKSAPSWAGRVAAAHTVVRESKTEIERIFAPAHAANITAPTLMLSGEESPDFLKADTKAVAEELHDVRVVVLLGQEHIADIFVPEIFSGHVLAFLSEEKEQR